MTTVERAIENLKGYNPKIHVAVAIWQTDDVLERAKERNIKLTKEEAEEIIDRIDRKQDATLGISWDTIDVYIDDYIYEEKKKRHVVVS